MLFQKVGLIHSIQEEIVHNNLILYTVLLWSKAFILFLKARFNIWTFDIEDPQYPDHDYYFLTEDNQIDLITDNTVTKNYLILVIKTQYKDLNPKSNEYEQFEAKARLNLINKIYQSHDNNLNEKYKVEFNERTIERVKNSF